METLTIKCQVVAKEADSLGYQTIVFKNLSDNCPFGHHFCMCVVFPNWESRIPELNEIGYLEYDVVIAGIDSYYDRTYDSIIKYNFSNQIFKRFVKEQDNFKKDIII